VLLRVADRTLAFVNAHLAAHEPKLRERNANYHRIRKEILARADELFVPGSSDIDIDQSSPVYHARAAPLPLPLPLPLTRSPSSLPGSNVYLERILQASGVPRDKVFMPFIADGSSWDDSYSVYQQTAMNEDKDDIRTNGKSINSKLTKSLDEERDEWPFDAVFFFGDLNYRIKGMSRSQMDRFITHVRSVEKKQLQLKIKKNKGVKKDIISRPKTSPFSSKSPVISTKLSSKSMPLLNRVLHFDQLTEQKAKRKAFAGFSEGAITFLPTYKYDRGSDQFDSSDKQRCPSWTDRVLFTAAGGRRERSAEQLPLGESRRKKKKKDIKKNKEEARGGVRVELEQYCSFDVRHSDHRPVAASFTLLGGAVSK
jgi:hypothetical protein